MKTIGKGSSSYYVQKLVYKVQVQQISGEHTESSRFGQYAG